MMKQINLNESVQINNGFTDTSGDGAALAFDKKYGIMFCAYMPGEQGHYGESRGRISLAYFPASQPTNIRFIDVICEKDVYANNIISIGEGKVRIFYEKDSRADKDHLNCYKDFNFLSGELSEEHIVMLKKEDNKIVPLSGSEQFAYLEKNGFYNHTYVATEQINLGCHTIFKGNDGIIYGTITSCISEPILFRSDDNLATVEFFAICPHTTQYEFDYKFLNGKIYGIGRTTKEKDSVFFTSSDDMGRTWTEAEYFEGSIQCRPRMIIHNEDILMSYNYYNSDTKNRPAIQQGRTSIKLVYGAGRTPVMDLYSKCGIVNVCLIDVLNEVYMAYSTSELALEYQNGNPMVRGKDAIIKKSLLAYTKRDFLIIFRLP